MNKKQRLDLQEILDTMFLLGYDNYYVVDDYDEDKKAQRFIKKIKDILSERYDLITAREMINHGFVEYEKGRDTAKEHIDLGVYSNT